MRFLFLILLTALLLCSGCTEDRTVEQAYMNPKHLEIQPNDSPEVVDFKRFALETRQKHMKELTTWRQREMFDAAIYRKETDMLQKFHDEEIAKLTNGSYPSARRSSSAPSMVYIDTPRGGGTFIPDGNGGGSYFGPGNEKRTIIGDGMGGGTVFGPGNERGTFVADGHGGGTYFGPNNSNSYIVSDGMGGGTVFGPGGSQKSYTFDGSTLTSTP